MAEELETVKYWKIQAPGLQELGKFAECSGLGIQVNASSWYDFDANGKPNPEPVGVHPTFTDVTLKRGVDNQSTLYQATSKTGQLGASEDAGTLMEISLLGLNSKGDIVHNWTLKNAFLSGYQVGGWSAGGTDVLTESVTIHYMEAQLDGKGGLTGAVD
jgi:phage tail-like protein